ncbi:hypothetical protein OROGR_031531 [Orobanche gracilis]
MEKDLKRCETHVTTKTWRAMEEEDTEMISSKKRKFYSDIQNEDYCVGEVEAAPESAGSYKHEEYSGDVVKKKPSDLESVDLQSGGFKTEITTSVNRVFSREATPPTSEPYGDSAISSRKTKSPTPPAIFSQKTADSIPSAEDLEEFFTAAEKYDQKRFVDKYNFDIVKDVPLEGKYQWVRLHP